MKQKITKEKIMKKVKGLIGVLLCSSLLFATLISCRMSTEELAKDVQNEYVSMWKEEGEELTVTKDLILVKKNKTEYTGLMTVSYYGETEVISINVVYDGNSWTSEIVD